MTDGVRRSRVLCRNSIGKAVMNAGVYTGMVGAQDTLR